MNRSLSRLVSLLITIALLLTWWQAGGTAHANGVALVKGDVLAGTGNGIVKHFTPTGVLRDSLDNGTNATYQTGMCFDASSNLYVTNFFDGSISKFSPSGTLINGSWVTGLSYVESCVFDKAGNMYASQVFGSGFVKISASGQVLKTYPVGRTDWIDLAADQCTMYFTLESSSIYRYNLCTNVGPSVFATLPSGSCYALRIRPNAEVMVACGDAAYRLSSTGTVLHTYSAGAQNETFLFALNLDPDGTSFWTGDLSSGDILHFDIATGELIKKFNSAPSTSLAGLTIVGEITAGGPGGGGGGTGAITVTTHPITCTAGSPCAITATFTDTKSQACSSYASTVTFGNGSSGTGTITGSTSGAGCSLSATTSYLFPGSFTFSVKVTNPNSTTGTSSNTVTVAGFPPSTAPTKAGSASNASPSTCAGTNSAINFGVIAQVNTSGQLMGAVQYTDSSKGIAFNSGTPFTLLSLQRFGSGPTDTGNTAVLYGSYTHNGVLIYVRFDLADLGGNACTDTVRVRTSAGYDSGVMYMADVQVTTG